MGTSGAPVTMSCTVAGHVLAADHWYRAPREGTRICGNVGHWLDLAVDLLTPGGLADRWSIALAWSDERERDDNLAINLTSERGDLVTIVLTARGEPFDGIHESLLVQQGAVMARIDDFQAMTLWQGERRRVFHYRPKDVGHRRAILQPFRSSPAEQAARWAEVVDSSLLMLAIAEMVRAGEARRDFRFSEERAALANRR